MTSNRETNHSMADSRTTDSQTTCVEEFLAGKDPSYVFERIHSATQSWDTQVAPSPQDNTISLQSDTAAAATHPQRAQHPLHKRIHVELSKHIERVSPQPWFKRVRVEDLRERVIHLGISNEITLNPNQIKSIENAVYAVLGENVSIAYTQRKWNLRPQLDVIDGGNFAQPDLEISTENVRQHIDDLIDRRLTKAWLKHLTLDTISRNCATFSVPFKFLRAWIAHHYSKQLLIAIQNEYSWITEIEIKCDPTTISQEQYSPPANHDPASQDSRTAHEPSRQMPRGFQALEQIAGQAWHQETQLGSLIIGNQIPASNFSQDYIEFNDDLLPSADPYSTELEVRHSLPNRTEDFTDSLNSKLNVAGSGGRHMNRRTLFDLIDAPLAKAVFFGNTATGDIEREYETALSEQSRLLELVFDHDFRTQHGKYIAINGFLERIEEMGRCLHKVFDLTPPNDSGIHQSEHCIEAEKNIQAFLFHLIMGLRNLELVWDAEKENRISLGVTNDTCKTGLWRGSISRSYRQSLRNYSTQRMNWHYNVVDFHTSLQHRVPFSAHPSRTGSDPSDLHQIFEAAKREALRTGNHDEHALLDSTERLLDKLHSSSTRTARPTPKLVVFHAQLIADLNTVDDLAHNVFEALTEAATLD